jgi:hypothetical protein
MKLEFTINFEIPCVGFKSSLQASIKDYKKGSKVITNEFINNWQMIIADEFNKTNKGLNLPEIKSGNVVITKVMY